MPRFVVTANNGQKDYPLTTQPIMAEDAEEAMRLGMRYLNRAERFDDTIVSAEEVKG
jgi:hypothetical protein